MRLSYLDQKMWYFRHGKARFLLPLSMCLCRCEHLYLTQTLMRLSLRMSAAQTLVDGKAVQSIKF